ncbi:hypothetical protein ACCUM_3878 [Candidatus Accumulibacter phosphatis]|jgi:hypothetical protein|uniref:Uncharacterized protein n=1 Tax=Candidatus Accumulibacter phosphatis TaxID=327160 RepID=A0A5S4EN50_9PROT|nr:hypothetical protein ACCUM_3878 [Candidatus Accumulibacter phosphatis]
MIGVARAFTIPRKIESKNHALLARSHQINGLVLVSEKRKRKL